jgi:hypothetical protein
VTVVELSGSASVQDGPECEHPNPMQGYPDVGICFCPDCGAYIDKEGHVLFMTEEE